MCSVIVTDGHRRQIVTENTKVLTDVKAKKNPVYTVLRYKKVNVEHSVKSCLLNQTPNVHRSLQPFKVKIR